MNRSCHMPVKLHVHGMLILDRCWKSICKIVAVNKMQFVFMLESETKDAVSILRMLQK